MLVLFFALWIIINGKFTAEIAIFGVAISLVVYLFAARYLGYRLKKEVKLYKKLGLVVGYAFVVLSEILKANICVFKIIFSTKKKPEPVLIRFRVDLRTDAARVALANSITLTPGTITISLEDGEYCVHCLDKSLSEGIDSSNMVRYLRKLEA